MTDTTHHETHRLARSYLRYGDRGASFFFDQTKPDATLPVYRDRTSLLYYLCRFSPKLSYLAVLLQQICQVHKRKALLFCDWPATAWLVEVLVLLLGFRTLTIRARHKSSERDRAVALFNDPESAFQVLVTNVKVSSTALNLQGDCSAVIFVDVPSNAQSTPQAAGRVIRIGQRKACNIYILTTDHTYDQVLQSIAARKMIAVIAAYTDHKVAAADVASWRVANPDSQWEDAAVEDHLMNEKCADDYRLLFGQRSRREDWGNVDDPTEKDRLPTEVDFRAQRQLASGDRLVPVATKTALHEAQAKGKS